MSISKGFQWSLASLLTGATVLLLWSEPTIAAGSFGCNFDDQCIAEYVPYTCENGGEGEYVGCDAGPKPGGGTLIICKFSCDGFGDEEQELGGV